MSQWLRRGSKRRVGWTFDDELMVEERQQVKGWVDIWRWANGWGEAASEGLGGHLVICVCDFFLQKEPVEQEWSVKQEWLCIEFAVNRGMSYVRQRGGEHFWWSIEIQWRKWSPSRKDTVIINSAGIKTSSGSEVVPYRHCKVLPYVFWIQKGRPEHLKRKQFVWRVFASAVSKKDELESVVL